MIPRTPGRRRGGSRHVDEGHERDVEGVAGADEAGRLLGALDVEHAGQHLRLVADDPDHVAVEAGEPAHDAAGPVARVLEELAVVGHGVDDVDHVVGLVRAVGHELGQLGAAPLGVVRRAKDGGSSRLLAGRKLRR
jgi:hypothetical protein